MLLHFRLVARVSIIRCFHFLPLFSPASNIICRSSSLPLILPYRMYHSLASRATRSVTPAFLPFLPDHTFSTIPLKLLPIPSGKPKPLRQSIHCHTRLLIFPSRLFSIAPTRLLHTNSKTLYIPIFVPKFILNNSGQLTSDDVPGVTKCDVTKCYTYAAKGLYIADVQSTVTKCCSEGVIKELMSDCRGEFDF
ncbi:hypothetical protein JN12_03612 [Geobacter argillaceus]|uniref:Uncharacterized protein n=1 Tax=Geobacter argillaceus TaxID=345631 RepID=A0A562V7L9_9BACT|nr:hypothetical protein JN12_03612 [Geobacter argillaceus]